MPRILAIDYGKKRTGIAVTDNLQMIANGLATIETKELERFILDYVAKEDVCTIVVAERASLLSAFNSPAETKSPSSKSIFMFSA